MENTTIENRSFSPEILEHVKTAANLALLMFIIIIIRLGFDVYNTITYLASIGTEWDKYAISYFSNSLLGNFLSLVSIYFLFRFYQFGTTLYRESNIQDWEGLFLQLRNYIALSIIILINWLFFFIVNVVLSRFLNDFSF